MSSVQFETPENVTIRYQTAGLGSRFLAFALDGIFLVIPYFLLLIALIAVFLQSDENMGEIVEKEAERNVARALFLLVAVVFMLWGILSVAYFAVFELFMRGQTPGKKIMHLRVVRTGGFSLDASGVIMRSVFRVLDNFPPLWVLMFFSPLHQRLGDLVARTVVVYDTPPDGAVQQLKETLLQRPVGAMLYNFNPVLARSAPWETVLVAEKLLLRWQTMGTIQKERFLDGFCKNLAEAHQLSQPGLDSAQPFLEEYLTLRYRQQYRNLG